ncbi:YlbF family regulator [Anaerolentibacter hominis]|uniref:YlbF family regulator n=1 Tax=Anaerolentibacter hominis TaxID=3079009 RepID=UPI0031B7F453
MEEMELVLDQLLEYIHSTEVYQAYQTSLKALKEKPELYDEVKRFCRKRFSYHWSDAGEGSSHLTELGELYEELRLNPVISAFLKAETDYCKLVRMLTKRIYEGLQIDPGFLEDEL